MGAVAMSPGGTASEVHEAGLVGDVDPTLEYAKSDAVRIGEMPSAGVSGKGEADILWKVALDVSIAISHRIRLGAPSAHLSVFLVALYRTREP